MKSTIVEIFLTITLFFANAQENINVSLSLGSFNQEIIVKIKNNNPNNIVIWGFIKPMGDIADTYTGNPSSYIYAKAYNPCKTDGYLGTSKNILLVSDYQSPKYAKIVHSGESFEYKVYLIGEGVLDLFNSYDILRTNCLWPGSSWVNAVSLTVYVHLKYMCLANGVPIKNGSSDFYEKEISSWIVTTTHETR